MKVISPEKREIYEFGGFRFDLAEQTIERYDGLSVDALPDKTLQILALLIKRRGHLVEKDDILEQIWPNSFVEENNVEKRVHQLRQFLGKTESGGDFIQTVRGHGYRFVGHVDVVEVSGTWLPETYRLPDENTHRENGNDDHADTNGSLLTVEREIDTKKPGASLRSSRKVILASAVGAVVIAIVVAYLGFLRTGSAGEPRTIAVLPVGPMNSADRNVHYEIGIADSLINRLSSVEGLTIRPLSSVRSYADTPMDPLSAGREQKVDFVLASNYQIADGKIKVTAQLYNVANGKVDDTFQSQEDIADVFRAQDAIAADFGDQLMARFGARLRGPLTKRGTKNAEAYMLYQQAKYLIDKRRPENSVKALEYLDQAVGLDPNYAQAWAARAVAVRTSGRNDNAEIHKIMTESIDRALAIDPDLSDAYSALCTDKLTYEYDFVEAEAACKQAIRLDPYSSTAHNKYSSVLKSLGRHDEALSEISAAIDLEPASYVNKRDYGSALYLSRRWDEAAGHYLRLLDLEPADAVLYNDLIRTLEAQGKEAEAFEWFIRLLHILKRDDQTIARYQAVYQTSGWRGVLLERAKDPNPGFPNGNNFLIACLYARAGEKDKAFELLESSLKKREWVMPQLQVHPQLDPIRDDPRFADLVRRIEGK
jgi:DNA-binding winged helix-turn-helix (wHTH) protein/tetratricopeptide (TPR) repeat protein